MRRRTILMLEHDDDDRYITQTYFDENQYDIQIHFVSDSDELMAYLGKCRQNNTYPSLILLNHFAAPLTAVEVLTHLKSHGSYKHIPVIVLSGSKNGDMVKKCYSLGASSFIQKPDEDHETTKKISAFVKYWFETVELN